MLKLKEIDKSELAQKLELVAGCGMIASVALKSVVGVYLSGCLAAAGIGITIADMIDTLSEEES